MNYLAHAYLSFNHPQLLVGNMIADYVKGSTQYSYPKAIQAGIQLHRAIDFFTDNHSDTQVVKQLFKPAYRLYAAAFVDVVFDYFLANDVYIFNTATDLNTFATDTYAILDQQQSLFPEKFAKMYPYMQAQNWLYNYRLDEGMQKSFGGLQKRAKFIHETDTAFDIFLNNKNIIVQVYDSFFPSLKSFANSKANELLNL